jgi:hypothetical protein
MGIWTVPGRSAFTLPPVGGRVGAQGQRRAPGWGDYSLQRA